MTLLNVTDRVDDDAGYDDGAGRKASRATYRIREAFIIYRRLYESVAVLSLMLLSGPGCFGSFFVSCWLAGWLARLFGTGCLPYCAG